MDGTPYQEHMTNAARASRYDNIAIRYADEPAVPKFHMGGERFGNGAPWLEEVLRDSGGNPVGQGVALFASAFQFGIEHGYATATPCRQVRRNKERPRSRQPSSEEIESFCAAAAKKGPSSHVIGLMVNFIALTGRRRAEFLNLRKMDLSQDGIVVGFAKAKAGDALRRGLIEWTPALRQLFAELAQLDRNARRTENLPSLNRCSCLPTGTGSHTPSRVSKPFGRRSWPIGSRPRAASGSRSMTCAPIT